MNRKFVIAGIICLLLAAGIVAWVAVKRSKPMDSPESPTPTTVIPTDIPEGPTPTAIPTDIPEGPTPTLEPDREVEKVDFSLHLTRFDASDATLRKMGSYIVKDKSYYYEADGSTAGSLEAGTYVYAKAFNLDCGNVYQVVINDKDYYMKPEDLFGGQKNTGVDASADREDTVAFCVAEGLKEYSHGDLWYYDDYGQHKALHIYDVNIDSVWYFVNLHPNAVFTDAYITRILPWGEMWARFIEDPAAFSETDPLTGHVYSWSEDTLCFLDLDMDGICEYEVKVKEWQKWKSLD